MRSTHGRTRGSKHRMTREEEMRYLEGVGFDMMTNGDATACLGWDNDDPDDIMVGTMDRGDAVHASIGEEYDDDGRPTGGWSGRIEYDPSGNGAGSYSIAGYGDSAEAAVADIESSLLKAMSMNVNGKYVTNETLNASRSESGFEFV